MSNYLEQPQELPEALIKELTDSFQALAVGSIATPAFQEFKLSQAASYLAVATALEAVAVKLRQTAVTFQ